MLLQQPMKAKTSQHGKLDRHQQKSLFASTKILFLLGPVLIAIGIFRNKIFRDVPRLWIASGNFWQTKWETLLDLTGGDDFTMSVYGTLTVEITFYWILGSVYMFFDITLKPETLRKYKIQTGTNEPVDRKKLMKVFRMVLFNQFVVSSLFAVTIFKLQEKFIGLPPLRELPSFQSILFHLACSAVIIEILNYYGHRLLHHHLLYRHIHKMHHEWTAPIAMVSIYCHPVEKLFTNLLPIYAGPFLMGSHVTVCWLLTMLSIISIMNSHSGYHLPFYYSSEAHDFHHLKFNQCYGVFGILDRLHNTDDLFRSSGVSQRDRILGSLTPAREAYPLPSDSNRD